jgi:hypothetical protein
MRDMITRNVERIVVGTALALGASVLLPIARTTLSAAANAGGRVLSSTLAGIRSGVQLAREELEDMVAEAQFERLKKQMEKEIGE